MTTLLYTHPACAEHDPGSYHPESPARLEAVLHAFEQEAFSYLERQEAPEGQLSDIELAHPPAYVEQTLDAIPSTGHVGLDGDTIVSSGSRDAALRAVGAICAAVDAVAGGEARNAFCAVRPPGHHAEAQIAMGFCLFNNVAIGALHARRVHGLRRVAVVDFDVHHGNGTQHMFETDETLFYASTHQWPLYPGTGAASERGVGNIVNVPLAPMSGSAEFRTGMEDKILPALTAFDPDMVLVSAGFDAHRADPLASLNLVEDDFAWATTRLAQVADTHCDGRLVSTLEGGYNLRALSLSAAAHVRALMAG
ncbi:MAG: histone deacetylase family protein [Alphaproteobacteria bacterium]|nr:histone deacetylase family protein [Alphaproteobacteria bacterium]